jgi:3-phosphoglycerate kinase
VSDGKVVITGDDVLIEYVQRLIKILKEIPEIQDSEIIDQNIEKFIVHFVWHKEDY